MDVDRQGYIQCCIRVCLVGMSGISLLPASAHWMGLSKRLPFSFRLKIPFPEVGATCEPLWDVRV